MTTCMKYCLLGLIWDLVVRLFLGVWWHNHPLPSTDPASRLPEGKQVLIHQGVCTNNSGTVSHPQLFWKLANPSWNSGSLMPARDPHSKQAFVRIADSCLFCECLCTERFYNRWSCWERDIDGETFQNPGKSDVKKRSCFLKWDLRLDKKEKDSRWNCRAPRFDPGPNLLSTCRRWRGRRIGMCFRKSGEAKAPQRRKCSLVYKILQTGRNYRYGDCKNAARTYFNNV